MYLSLIKNSTHWSITAELTIPNAGYNIDISFVKPSWDIGMETIKTTMIAVSYRIFVLDCIVLATLYTSEMTVEYISNQITVRSSACNIGPKVPAMAISGMSYL